MIRFLAIFFPPLIAVLFRCSRGKVRSAVQGTLEYMLWTLLDNTLILLLLGMVFGYRAIDLDTVPFISTFALKYILLSSMLSLAAGVCSIRFPVSATLEEVPPEPPEKRKGWEIAATILSGILVLLGVLLYTASGWLMDNFGLLTWPEIIFHLTVPLKGANPDYIWTFIRYCLCPAVLLTAFYLVFIFWRYRYAVCFHINLARKKDGIFRCSSRCRRRYSPLIGLLVLALGIAQINSVLGLRGLYTYLFKSSAFIEQNYVDPEDVQLTFPDEKRNLIYIFMESMEDTYLSTDLGGAEENNLIPRSTPAVTSEPHTTASSILP